MSRAPLLVAGLVERKQNFLANSAALGQNCIDKLGRCVLEAGKVSVAIKPYDMFEDEPRIADGSMILRQGVSPGDKPFRRRRTRPPFLQYR